MIESMILIAVLFIPALMLSTVIIAVAYVLFCSIYINKKK